MSSSDLDVSDTTTESDEGDDDRDDASTRDEQKQPVTTEEASFVSATSQLVLPSPVNGHFTPPLPLALKSDEGGVPRFLRKRCICLVDSKPPVCLVEIIHSKTLGAVIVGPDLIP